MMPNYHLYFMRHGVIIASEDIAAGNDEEAVQIARSRTDGDAVEVWNDHQRLDVLRTAGEPLALIH